VALDGSDYDSAAVHAAVEMLGPRGELVLTTVVTPPDHVLRDESGRHVLAYIDQQEEALTREARESLASVAEPLRTGPRPVSVTPDIRLGDPVSGIAMAAIETHADLIVMATHGRAGINRAVFGSLAGCVLRTVRTPVVLVHPTSPSSEDAGLHEPTAMEIGPVPTF